MSSQIHRRTNTIYTLYNYENRKFEITAKGRKIAITNQKMREKLGTFLRQYPEKKELSKMYSLMGENIRKFRLELNYLQPEIIEEDSVFTYLRWEMQVTATFQRFMKFLREIEIQHQFFQIEKIDFRKSNRSGDFLTIHMQLKLILISLD